MAWSLYLLRIITYLIISVEYPTTKIENSICISSKMRSIQIMVHYYKTKKMAAWDHTLPQPHSTFTPYVLLDQAIVLLLPKKQIYHWSNPHLLIPIRPGTEQALLLFVVSNTSDTYYYLVKSPYYYSSKNNQCCKFKSACVKSNSKVLCSAVSNPLNYHPELSSKNKTLYHNG
jgi:hypothetical protein